MKLDLHVHSRYSKCAVTKEETIVKQARYRGMGFAITDHNTGVGWRALSALAKKEKIPFIQGEEIKVYENGSLVGELLALFMQEPVENGNLFAVLDKLKAQDALISIAHPFDSLRAPYGAAGFRRINKIKNKIDAVEVFNSRVYFNGFNSKARQFAEANGLGKTAGSDAHFPSEIGKAFVEVEASSLEEVRKAIKKGKVKVSGRLSGVGVHFYTQLAKLGLLKPI